MKDYDDIMEWIEDCRRLVRQDLDNVVLFTGPEGVGKSTIMYQVCKALDPDFNLSRLSFDIPGFLENATLCPRYGARAADEFLLNKRKAMHKDTVRVLDHLQICRGLNHHIAVCFPHAGLLDEAVLNTRVRWNVNVTRRGFFELRSRVAIEKKNGGVDYRWRIHGRFRFRENRGREWDAYLKAKREHTDAITERAAAESRGEDPDKDDDDPAFRDWDVEAWRTAWAALAARYDAEGWPVVVRPIPGVDL